MSTKQQVLTLLEKRKLNLEDEAAGTKNLSGERIAEILGVSRNAVWKAVNELKKDGYIIEAAPNRGYILSDDNDILSAEGIKPFLSKEIISDELYIFKSLDSTNKTAKEMAISGAAHGTTVIADRQTDGKGRFGRGFFSPAGGLYMSFILRPEYLALSDNKIITAFAGITVCDAVKKISNKSPRIKPVNDIFLNGKKICGILTEGATDFESETLHWIVLGIGINFNIEITAFPDDLAKKAGSIFSNGKPPVTRNRLAAEIINGILNKNPPSKAEIFEIYNELLINDDGLSTF